MSIIIKIFIILVCYSPLALYAEEVADKQLKTQVKEEKNCKLPLTGEEKKRIRDVKEKCGVSAYYAGHCFTQNSINWLLEYRLRLHREWKNECDSKASMSFDDFKNKCDLQDPRRLNLCGADLSKLEILDKGLSGANLSFTNLKEANLSSADLSKANLAHANLSCTNLKQADLSNANLTQADLSKANLTQAGMSAKTILAKTKGLDSITLSEDLKTVLKEKELTLKKFLAQCRNLPTSNYYKAELTQQNFDDLLFLEDKPINLCGANLAMLDLSNQDLSKMNFALANLMGANLQNANLKQANLTGANLEQVDLTSANLSHINLTKANLEGANLTNANIAQAILTDVSFKEIVVGKKQFTKKEHLQAGLTFGELVNRCKSIPFHYGQHFTQAELDKLLEVTLPKHQEWQQNIWLSLDKYEVLLKLIPKLLSQFKADKHKYRIIKWFQLIESDNLDKFMLLKLNLSYAYKFAQQAKQDEELLGKYPVKNRNQKITEWLQESSSLLLAMKLNAIHNSKDSQNTCKLNLCGANLSGLDLSNRDLSMVNLAFANLRKASLCSTNLTQTNLSQANLSQANLSYANLRQARLLESYLNRAQLSNSNLIQANLSNARLTKADLSLANLSKANLSTANLSKADIWFANLSDANLRATNMAYTNLYWSTLTAADLTYANLYKTDLSDADLSKADLTSANLNNVDFSRADLSDTIFKDTNIYQLNLSAISTPSYSILQEQIPDLNRCISYQKQDYWTQEKTASELEPH
ncbi:pentapeptide repeat-containing protein [Candidatus Albibeggiatoa sp. nov. NOAA]|uniref:pentapeptide repeat-containing protein n=1 Tax=Candidatus Albibeggiatoa sp. nov. NOAA TaxID=3162724 RepID=UPI0032F6F2E9|nr:pentapeptide repeat-containing protein [Thiotrichaceae bacterium]